MIEKEDEIRGGKRTRGHGDSSCHGDMVVGELCGIQDVRKMYI